MSRFGWKLVGVAVVTAIVVGGLAYVLAIGYRNGSLPLTDYSSSWPVWAQVVAGVVIGVVVTGGMSAFNERRDRKQVVHYVRVVVDADGNQINRHQYRSEWPRAEVDRWINRCDEMPFSSDTAVRRDA